MTAPSFKEYLADARSFEENNSFSDGQLLTFWEQDHAETYRKQSMGDTRAGLNSGVATLGALTDSAQAWAGDLLGFETFRDNNIAEAQAGFKEAGSYGKGRPSRVEDIDGVGDAVDWVQYTLGTLAPMAAESVLSALAGGIVGGASGGAVGAGAGVLGGLATRTATRNLAKNYVAAGIEKAAAKKLARDNVTKYINGEIKDEAVGAAVKSGYKSAGASVGLVASEYGMGLGDTYSETVEAGDPSPWLTAGVAAPYAALGSMPQIAALNKLLGGGAGRSRALNAVKGGIQQAPSESLSEGLQEELLIRLHNTLDPEYDVYSDEVNSQRKNAYAAGALGGFGFGATSGVAQSRADKEQSIKDEIKSQGGDALDQEVGLGDQRPDMDREQEAVQTSEQKIAEYLAAQQKAEAATVNSYKPREATRAEQLQQQDALSAQVGRINDYAESQQQSEVLSLSARESALQRSEPVRAQLLQDSDAEATVAAQQEQASKPVAGFTNNNVKSPSIEDQEAELIAKGLKKPKIKVDPEKDSISRAIVKNGGIARSEVLEDGVDPSDIIKGAGNNLKSSNPMFRVNGGKSLDEMAEALAQDGYLDLDENGKPNVIQLREFIDKEIKGQSVYAKQQSNQGIEQQAEDYYGREYDDSGQAPLTNEEMAEFDPPNRNEDTQVKPERKRVSLAGKDGDLIAGDNGYIDIKATNVDAAPTTDPSILDFVVNEGERGRGEGSKLFKQALAKYPKLQGQFSSKSSVAIAYKNGLRNPKTPDGSLQDHIEKQEKDSSIYMRTQQHDAKSKISEASKEAALSPENNLPEPTDKQKEAGNYKKGHITIGKLDISIENPKGSTRSGKDSDGKAWSNKIKSHYGYIKGTVGHDKDHVDVFIGDNADSAESVYIVDQIDPKTGLFDEHKVMLGYQSESKAKAAYLENYTKDWAGLQDITAMPVVEFEAWVYDKEKTNNPVGEKIKDVGKEVVVDAIQEGLDDKNDDQNKQSRASKKSKPAEPKQNKEKIKDFGEKIGGARKDTSHKTGKKPSNKSSDDRPAWQKRYAINEIVSDMRSPESVGRFGVYDKRKGRFVRDGYKLMVFETEAEGLAAVPMIEVMRNHRVNSYRDGDETKYSVVRLVSDRKRPVIQDGFDSREDAAKYIAENAVKIIETKTRIDDNIHPALLEVIRKGTERRDNGKNVGTNDFNEVFGFRGGEFGDWVNSAEGQHILNQAYDALLDMADMLNVPPKALSLNGELGIAFGARGQGLSGARAHYETDYAAINITKIKGAGSLAHEWLHAFDHYLARQDGKASSEKVENKRGDKVFKMGRSYPNSEFVSHRFSYGDRSNTRPEIKEAFNQVMEVILNREVEFTEDTSLREKVEADKREELNTHLDKFLEGLDTDYNAEKEAGQRSWLPYRGKAKNGKAPKELIFTAKKIIAEIKKGKYGEQETVTSPRTRLKQRSFYGAAMRLQEIFKQARGKQGFSFDTSKYDSGQISVINQAIAAEIAAREFLAEAKSQKVKEKTVKTEYYSEAWAMDQGAKGDYWSTKHELAARSFESYIYDKLKGIDARSDFLAYEKNNNHLEYKLFNAKPYPEGKERVSMNDAWDNLFSTLETKETDKGTALYSKGKVVTELTGNEIDLADGAYEAAKKFYRSQLQGEEIDTQIGVVKFTGKGWKEYKNGLKVDAKKAQLIPAVKAIIQDGEYHGRELLYKERKDDIVAFHFFTADVSLDGEVVQAGVSVGENSNGKLFYNLNHDTDVLWDKKTKGLSESVVMRHGTKPLKSVKNDDLNITILSINGKVNALTEQQATAQLSKNKRLSAAIKAGLLKVVQSVKDIPAGAELYSKNNSVQGATLNGVAYVVADGNTTEILESTSWHEITHAFMNDGDFTNSEARAKLMKRLDNMRNLGEKGSNQFWKDVNKRVADADTNPEHVLDEVAGYAVTEYLLGNENLPTGIKKWAQDFIAAIKAFLFKTSGGKIQWGDVSPQELISIAEGYVDSVTKKSRQAEVGNEVALASKQGYEGKDPSEAKEWLDAVAKGLDMSYEARMERAKAMGYLFADKTYHEGVLYNTKPLTKDRAEKGRYYGKYTKQAPFNDAKKLSERLSELEIPHKKHVAKSGSVYITVEADPYKLRDGTYTVGEVEFRFSDHHKNIKGDLIEDYDSSYLAESLQKIENLSGLRSIHAAFDPAMSESSNLLASKAEPNTKKILEQWRKKIALMGKSRNDDFTAYTKAPIIFRELALLKSIAISKKKLSAILSKHPELPDDIISLLPELISDPKIIYVRQQGETNVVVNASTAKGEPIIVGIKDGEIKTITPKNNHADKKGVARLANEINRGKLLYARDKKTLAEAKVLSARHKRQQLPNGGQGLVGTKILFKDDIVKAYKLKGGQPLFSKGGNTTWRDEKGFENMPESGVEVAGYVGAPPSRTLKARVSEVWDEAKKRAGVKLRQGVLDQYESVKSILGDRRSWMLAQMAGAAGGVVEMAIAAGRPFMHKSGVVQINESKKSLAEVFEPLNGETQRFLMWIAGNRAEGLKDQGKENLFDDEKIAELKRYNRNDYTADGTVDWADREETYEAVRKEFEEIHNAVVQIGVDTGLVSKEDAKIWKNQGFYVPFYRLADEDADAAGHGLSSVSGLVGQNAYKKLKGADMQLNDLLLNTVMNWEHIISASLKNQAAASALRTAEDIGIATTTVKSAKGKKSVFIREDGEEVWYDIEDSTDGRLVLESITALNYQGLNNPAMKTLRKFKRILTIGVTASPEFKIANFIRDTLQAIAVGDMSTNFIGNVNQGMKLTKGLGSANVQAIAAGGLFGDSGYINGGDPDAIKMVLAKGVDQAEILDTEHKVKKWWNKYQDFGVRLENVNRISNIQQNIDKGQDLLSANFAGRDHLDFQRSGAFTAVRFLTQVIPFLNARAQGLDKLGRAMADPKQRKQLVTVLGLYSMASVMLYLYMKDDEDYQEAEDWERDTYHLIKLPNTEKMVRIPRPFELGALANVIERGVEQWADPDVEGEVFFERIAHSLSETFALSVIPQALAPAMEVRANKSSFTGRGIESQSMQRLSPVNRRKHYTSQTAVGASKVMSAFTDKGLSPIQIDHLVNGYFGWAGSVMLEGVDLLARPMVGAPSKPSMQIQDYPIVGRFLRESKARNAKQITELYDNRGELNTLFADIENYKADGELSEYRVLLEKHKSDLRLRKTYNKVSLKLSKMSKQIVKISKDKTLSSEMKRDKINRINVKRINLAKETVERFKLIVE